MEIESSLKEIGKAMESSLKESSLTERLMTLVEKNPTHATIIAGLIIGGLISLGHHAIKSPKQASIQAGPFKAQC